MNLTPATQETSAPPPAAEAGLSAPSAETATSLRKFELLLLLAICIGPFLVSAIFIYVLYRGVWPNSSFPYSVLYGTTMKVLQEASGLALLLYILFRQGRKVRDIGLSFRWSDVPVSLGLLLLSWIAVSICSVLIGSVYHLWTGRHLEHWNGAAALLGSHISIMVVAFLVLNAFFEELIVRAYVMSEIISWKNSALLAGVVSVSIQSLYHIYQGVPNMLALAGLFSVYAIYYAKTQRIFPVILAHFYVDAASAALLFFYHA
jgi:membrane protease YdiL (CAAX protease family)